MTRQLPPNPSLVQLRKQAKDTLKAHKSGDASCCEVLRQHHRFKDRDDKAILSSKVGLREVQHALSIDYGFKGWVDLRKHVLFESIKSGRMSEVKEWVSSGSEVDARTDINETPLMWASSNGHLEIVEYLVENGAEINAQYDAGNTPLIVASWYGHLGVVQYLVEQGADIQIRNLGGHQAIHWATEHGHLDIVKFLQASGADIHSVSNDGCNLLTEACEDGHLDAVEYLLSQGVDIESERAQRDGFTPLVAASYKGYADIVNLLLENGANVHAGHDSPLGWACGFSQIAVAEALIKHGANVNGVGGEGSTFLQEAMQQGRTEVAEMLLRHGATPMPLGQEPHASVTEADGELEDPRNGRAKELLRTKDWNALLGHADAWLNDQPSAHYPVYYRAHALWGLERWKEATDGFRMAKRLEPKWGELCGDYIESCEKSIATWSAVVGVSPEIRETYATARQPQFFVNMEGRIIAANTSAERAMGLQGLYDAPKHLASVLELPPDQAKAFQDMVLHSFSTGREKPFDMKMGCVHANGKPLVEGEMSFSVRHFTDTEPEALLVTVNVLIGDDGLMPIPEQDAAIIPVRELLDRLLDEARNVHADEFILGELPSTEKLGSISAEYEPDESGEKLRDLKKGRDEYLSLVKQAEEAAGIPNTPIRSEQPQGELPVRYHIPEHEGWFHADSFSSHLLPYLVLALEARCRTSGDIAVTVLNNGSYLVRLENTG